MATITFPKTTDSFNSTVTMFVCNCASCGVRFAYPESLNKIHRETGETFYCPSGHSNVYRKTSADLLKEKLEKEKADHDSRLAEMTNRFLDASLEVKKKNQQLKRLTNGLCPCCNRSFHNLQEHMKKQHPEAVIPNVKK